MLRNVYIIHWARTPKNPISFHYCLLVLDEGYNEITANAQGMRFDWGSITPPIGKTKLKRLDERMYQTQTDCRCTYRGVGETHFKDSEIEKIMDEFGSKFNIATNNCRIVTENVANAILKNPQIPSPGLDMSLFPPDMREQTVKAASNTAMGWHLGSAVLKFGQAALGYP